MADVRTVMDPTGSRWAVTVGAPGSLSDSNEYPSLLGGRAFGGMVGGFFRAARKGWRVAVFRVDDRDHAWGAMYRERQPDEQRARARAQEIVDSLEDGSWRWP